MNAPTEHQIIERDGVPLFALVPYDEYLELIGARPDEEITIPNDVVGLMVRNRCSLIRAWREHLELTQTAVAERMGVTQPAYAQMEAKDAKPRVATLKKIAGALGVAWEQLHG